jgi:hypothetical protein
MISTRRYTLDIMYARSATMPNLPNAIFTVWLSRKCASAPRRAFKPAQTDRAEGPSAISSKQDNFQNTSSGPVARTSDCHASMCKPPQHMLVTSSINIAFKSSSAIRGPSTLSSRPRGHAKLGCLSQSQIVERAILWVAPPLRFWYHLSRHIPGPCVALVVLV